MRLLRALRGSSHRGFLAFCAVAIAAALLFAWLPELDLAAAALFHAPGDGFPLARSAYAELWYRGVPLLRNFVVVPAGAALLISWLVRRRLPFGIEPRAFALVALTLLLGWGLLANELLKNHVGRARPRDVTRFGGERDFTPAFFRRTSASATAPSCRVTRPSCSARSRSRCSRGAVVRPCSA